MKKSKGALTASLQSAFGLIVELDLSSWDLFLDGSSLAPERDFTKIAYSDDSSYLDIYLAGYKGGFYNFLMKDYSFFQFWEAEGSARYAFYPNPFDLSKLNESDIFSDSYSSLPAKFSRAPIRYDYDKQSHRCRDHPAAHFHIGTEEDSRIMSGRVISPLLFVMLILRKYYFPIWRKGRGGDLDKVMTSEREKCVIDPIYIKEDFSLFHII